MSGSTYATASMGGGDMEVTEVSVGEHSIA